MAFSVCLKGHGSWLDPESAGILGWQLGKRLAARIAGRTGRFITLTYDRKHFASAQECFDRSRHDKHVSRFMRKFGRLLGRDLRGKWLCKMEFQRDGWVHWHIVLVDVGMLSKPQLSAMHKLWAWGNPDVKPLTKENARYLMKYVAKDGYVPGWLYGYPSRSIKVVRPSQGFWNDEQSHRAAERTAARKARAVASGGPLHATPVEPEYFVPIGAKIKTQRATICDGERTFTVVAAHDVLLCALRVHCGQSRKEGGWRHYEASSRQLDRVVAACNAASTAATPSAGAQPHCRPRYGMPLVLIGTRKRDGWWAVMWRGKWRYLSPLALTGRLSQWWAENAPWWVKLDWEQDGRSRSPEACLADAVCRGAVYA